MKTASTLFLVLLMSALVLPTRAQTVTPSGDNKSPKQHIVLKSSTSEGTKHNLPFCDSAIVAIKNEKKLGKKLLHLSHPDMYPNHFMEKAKKQ